MDGKKPAKTAKMAVWDDPELDEYAVNVFNAMDTFCTDRVCWASQGSIANRCRYAIKTVRNRQRVLEARGWITGKEGKHTRRWIMRRYQAAAQVGKVGT